MWPEVALNELGYVSRGKSKHRPRNDPSLYGGPYPFIQTAEVKAADLWITSHTQTYSEKGLAQSRIWPENTLCITIAANIADTALLSYPACFPDSIIGFIADESKCDVRFVKYHFDVVQEHMRMVSHGTTQDNLSQDKLLRFAIPCPTLDIQRKIGGLLSSYDDLIENNHRRIALLEESARLLYREWFVNLRFPGGVSITVKDGVPEGWTRSTLGSICDQIREPADPAQVAPDTPYLSMEHMIPKSIALGTWETAGKVTSSKLHFQKNDVLFGRIRPYFHKVGVAMVDGITSTDMIVTRPKGETLLPLVALVMSSDEFVAHAVTTSNGTKMPRADWKVLKNWVILLPGEKDLEAFSDQVLSIVEAIAVLSKQNKALTEARDLLLPKLMSGEIQV